MQVIIEKVKKENDLPFKWFTHARIQKVLSEGSNFNFLLAGHQWPASETPFKWRFASGPMVAQH